MLWLDHALTVKVQNTWPFVGILHTSDEQAIVETPPEGTCGGVGGGGMLPDFFFCSLFPVQQTTSGIGHRVK